MVVLNINTSDSLVNGFLETVIDVIAEKNETVKSIIVRFDSDKVGIKQRQQCKKIGTDSWKIGQIFKLSVIKLDSFGSNFELHKTCIENLKSFMHLQKICSSQSMEFVIFFKVSEQTTSMIFILNIRKLLRSSCKPLLVNKEIIHNLHYCSWFS